MKCMGLFVHESDIARPRALLRVFRRELDPLAFAQQFEHRPPDRAAVEEVLDPAFVANETEAFVDEQSRDCPGWHNPKPFVPNPGGYPRGTRPVAGACEGVISRRDAGPAEVCPALAQLGNRGQSRYFRAGSQAEADL